MVVVVVVIVVVVIVVVVAAVAVVVVLATVLTVENRCVVVPVVVIVVIAVVVVAAAAVACSSLHLAAFLPTPKKPDWCGSQVMRVAGSNRISIGGETSLIPYFRRTSQKLKTHPSHSAHLLGHRRNLHSELL